MQTVRVTPNVEPPLRAAWLHVLFPLAAGTLVYLLARPAGLRVFGWVEAVGLAESLNRARDASHSVVAALPALVRFSLPNALWVYSFAWLLSALWDHRATRQSLPWLLIAPVLGLGWELGQLAGTVPGTFDPLDLALTFVASLLALKRPLAPLLPVKVR
ncbi:MAG: hypothetical protein HS104_18260 [Polyangiaceae bacterium]|nr:hypothetical protein [Polyangiaceae bacterium]MBK9001533.1 hypothetical protein [Myxococcales bacterium]